MVRSEIIVPQFEQVVFEGEIKDGYWLGTYDVNSDGKPNFAVSDLEFSEAIW